MVRLEEPGLFVVDWVAWKAEVPQLKPLPAPERRLR